MALVSSSQSTMRVTNPTIALTEALTEFERALTNDQRSHFHNMATRPQPLDVIAFVTQIDANNEALGRKCVASRLSTLLEATKQFVGVVDTITSGSQIASLVWGSLKFTIVAASNVLSFFDQVTNLIMNVGRTTPVYKQFGQLYPDSIDLQQALCDYYATVVRMCTKIVELSQRTFVKHTLLSIMTPFDSEFKPIRDQLEQNLNQVHLHISLASKQASRSEHRENRQHRFLSIQEYKDARQWRLQQSNKQRARVISAIKNDLSNIDYFKSWRLAYQQRAPFTADWLQQDPDFLSWKDGQHSATLWCSGTLGLGKTVLISNTIAHLQHASTHGSTVCYHFCRSEDRASLDIRMILGTIIRQMIDNEIERLSTDDLKILRPQAQNLEAEAVVEFALPLLKQGHSYFVVLDGLDEMESNDIQILARHINRLCKERIVKVVYVGRPELERHLFWQFNHDYKIMVTRSRTQKDVDHFATAELDKCLATGKLRLHNPDLIVTIKENLHCESEEIFLWTKLFIEEMCAQQNENDILQALKSCPRKLFPLLDRKLERARCHDAADLAMKVLQYCSVLRRPLTLHEHRELLSLEIGQQAFDHTTLPTDMDRVIIACNGLIAVDEQDETLHYVHHSVRKYLLSNSRLDEVPESQIDMYVGDLCLTYLNLNDFKRQLTKSSSKSTVALQPIQLGVMPLFSYSNSKYVAGVAQSLLRQRHQFKSFKMGDLERNTQDEVDTENTSAHDEDHTQQYLFLEYAKTYWVHHFREMEEKRGRTQWTAFCMCISSDDNHRIWRPWNTDVSLRDVDPHENQGLHKIFKWSVLHGHHGLLLYLLLVHRDFIREDMKREVFQSTAFWPRLRSVSMIVTNTTCSDETLDLGLRYAASMGDLETVEILLAAGAVVDGTLSSSFYKRTALFCAANNGHLEIVERLLTAGANVNTSAPNGLIEGLTPLLCAAENGHLEVVESLLSAGAYVDASTSMGVTPLWSAAQQNHLEVVNRLLAAGANPNAANSDGWTPLSAAANNGHLEMIERLLAAEADVDPPHATDMTIGRTPLSYAAGQGHLDIVERLLAAGANVNICARTGWNALTAAAVSGNPKVVEALLVAGADPNDISEASRTAGLTALSYAAEHGHTEIVERLMAAQTNTNVMTAAGSRVGSIALLKAAGQGHLKIVERLLSSEVPDKDVRKAIKAATVNHHDLVVQRLRGFLNGM